MVPSLSAQCGGSSDSNSRIVSEEMKMFSTNWCQDLRSVNNNMIPRNEILKEVNNILETLHSIVYKLSVSQSVREVIVSQDFNQ